MADLEKLFYINVGEGGTFKPSGDTAVNTTAADIDKIFAELKAKNQKKLLLYFHGGLVNAKNGMITAKRIVGYAKRDTTNTYSYPICFVWETGLGEIVFQSFGTIKKSEFFKKLLIKIIKVAGKKLGVDLDDSLLGAKGIGSMSEEEIKLQLEKDAPFEKTFEDTGKRSASLKAAVAGTDNDLFYENIVKPEVQADLEEEISNDAELLNLAASEKPPEEAKIMKEDIADTKVNGEKGVLTFAKLVKAAVKITLEVIKRHIRKRDHGFYPTIIEEIFREIYVDKIGSWVWGEMKGKAKNMWKDDDFTSDPEKWHAGSYLLHNIKKYQEEVGELTIDLIGHSAGSIAICELVDTVSKRYPELKFRNIVFMAPACRCDLFANTVLKQQGSYKSLRIFTMLDSYEQKDHLVPVLYPRSLLYFISGILEEKEYDAYILGLQRHIIGNKPYDSEELLNTIKDHLLLENRMVYSVTKDDALEGFRSGSMKHGDFDNDGELTLDSIFYLIKQ